MAAGARRRLAIVSDAAAEPGAHLPRRQEKLDRSSGGARDLLTRLLAKRRVKKLCN